MKPTVSAVSWTVVLGIAACCWALPVAADTTEVKSQSWVYVKKSGGTARTIPTA